MRRCKALPRLWLFTDPRWDEEALQRAIARLPKGAAGVIFRDYDAPDRPARAVRLRQQTRARRLIFIVAGDLRLAQRVKADGVHLPSFARTPALRRTPLCITASAHHRQDMRRAQKTDAALIFLSPIFATASHPGARTLGRLGFAQLARHAHSKVAALGGMTARKARALTALGAHGWGAIDAWRS